MKRIKIDMKNKNQKFVPNKFSNLKSYYTSILKFSIALALFFIAAIIISGAGINVKDGGLNVSGNLSVNIDTLFVDSTNNRVGIGTSNPRYQIDNAQTITDTSGNPFGGFDLVEINPESESSATIIGFRHSTETLLGNKQNYTGILLGLAPRFFHNGEGIVTESRGLNLVSRNRENGTITLAMGGRFSVVNDKTGTITNARGGSFFIDNQADGGTITNAYVGHFTMAGVGTSVNSYGIFIDQLIGTNKWQFYGNTSDPSYFGGNVGINQSSPSATLDVEGTVEIDGDNGGCLKMRDTDDAGYTYCTALDGTISCSTTPC